MIKKLRYFILIGLVLLLSPLITVLAIPNPDTQQITSAYAFQSVINTNDQLHLFSFDIGTTALTSPASEAMLFRLYDDTTEIATATPSDYFNDGWTQGVVGFYFSSTDTNLPTWGTTNLSLKLVGNPAVVWDTGDPPETSINGTSWIWNTNVALLPARVRILAAALETEWGISLTEQTQGVTKLSANGEDYFEEVIPNLRVAAPSIFASGIVNPDFPTDNKSMTYSANNTSKWTGTGLELDDVAPHLNTSESWVYSIAWLAISFGVLFAGSTIVSKNQGSNQFSSGAMRPALFIFGAMLIMGSMLDFMVKEAGLWVGIIGGLALILSLFWRGAP